MFSWIAVKAAIWLQPIISLISVLKPTLQWPSATSGNCSASGPTTTWWDLIASVKWFHLWNELSLWRMNRRKQRETQKSDAHKDVRTRISKHETGGWGVWSWEGRIEDKKLRRERKERSAACHPSLGQRSRRLHDSSLCPELLSRTHTPCLVGIPACSMAVTHQHTNHMETSRISTFLPIPFSPSVVTHHHMSTQKTGHVFTSSIYLFLFFLHDWFLQNISSSFPPIFLSACCVRLTFI